MTVERAVIVGVPPSAEVDELIADIRSAAARGRKADPGERGDIVRFEALATQLEQLAGRFAAADSVVAIPMDVAEQEMMLFGTQPADWEESVPAEIRGPAAEMHSLGLRPVLLSTVLERGEAEGVVIPVAPPEPSERWESTGSRGRKAVEERFRAQIEEALDTSRTDGGTRAISPSGIQNPVVTEILREFVSTASDGTTVYVPVEYRDGSQSARPLALRSLKLQDELSAADIELRFALLSIRHTEMDAIVHGAWLRNAEISRPRPAAQTDDLVYEITRTQLEELTKGDRAVALHMYQTGLETVVVGFYKALTDHLLQQPLSVAVQPMYFAGAARRPNRSTGRGRNRQRKRKKSITQDRSPFRRGTPWAM